MMSIIHAVQARVSSNRNPVPRGSTPRGRRFAKPARELKTFVHTHTYQYGPEEVSTVGFAVVTDRGTFFDSARRPGMVRVVTTHRDYPAMAWYWDDYKFADSLFARFMEQVVGCESRMSGGWRRMVPTTVKHDD